MRSRRDTLRTAATLLGTGVAATGLGSAAGDSTPDSPAPVYRHEAPAMADRSSPIGGGQNYTPTHYEVEGYPSRDRRFSVDEADHVVDDAEGFAAAVRGSDQDDLIFVRPTTVDLDDLDLGYGEALEPAEGVTIYAPRHDGAHGALLRTGRAHQPLLRLTEPGVLLSGLRFEAPWPHWVDEAEFEDDLGGWKVATAVGIEAGWTEVANCRFRGWTHAGIEIGRSFDDGSRPERVHLHHNDFLDNACNSLGYGVATFHGESLIRHNYTDNNRHAIAGDGAPNCEYTAAYNVQGWNTRLHVYDMHGHDGGAGRRVVVHDNYFFHHSDHGVKQPAVFIRAEPRETSVVRGNVTRFERRPERTGYSEDPFVVSSGAEDFRAAGVILEDNVYRG